MKNRIWHNYKFATIFVSAYLLLYTLLNHAGAPFAVVGIMYVLSPFLLIWMAYTILRFSDYKGRELKEGEEWGYGDKNKEDLGTF